MDEAVVELRGATKRYGEVEALRGLDLAISSGQVVALLGPNGAGKTTAISLMLGLREPTTGTARLFGLDPRDRRARSRCGVMLQESGVDGALRVGELVRLFSSYYPDPMPAGRALALAGLEEQAGKPAAKLSGGQRQRLYFALAVCGNPELVFLDEPTVGMDVEGRRGFMDTVKRFGEEGRTVVLTTHYLAEADELAHRVVVVDHGVVVADGTPAAIKARVGGKRISFATAHACEGALAGLPVTSSVIDGERVRLLTAEPEAVLRELFARGVEIRDLEVIGAGLEEAFISITREAAS